MLSHGPAAVVDEPLRVDEVDAAARLLLRQPLQLEEAHELHGNPDASRPSAEEQDTV